MPAPKTSVGNLVQVTEPWSLETSRLRHTGSTIMTDAVEIAGYLSARLCNKSSTTHLPIIGFALHAGDLATSHAIIAHRVVMDENS